MLFTIIFSGICNPVWVAKPTSRATQSYGFALCSVGVHIFVAFFLATFCWSETPHFRPVSVALGLLKGWKAENLFEDWAIFMRDWHRPRRKICCRSAFRPSLTLPPLNRISSRHSYSRAWSQQSSWQQWRELERLAILACAGWQLNGL
eukprot:symbB.v1.2.025342.t1/scaffold2431.1/size102990/6